MNILFIYCIAVTKLEHISPQLFYVIHSTMHQNTIFKFWYLTLIAILLYFSTVNRTKILQDF
jgi:hypothetical protein